MVASAIALCFSAGAVSAQGLGIGGHIGTTGVGADLAVALNNHLALHGSLGTIPVKPNATFSDLEFKVEPPKTLSSIGVDLYPGAGSFHVSGGVLMGAQTTTLTGTYTGTTTINGRQYQGSELGTIIGDFETSNAAPYVGLGLGRHAAPGFGLFLDLGVAFMGDPTFTLTSNNNRIPPAQKAQFDADLEAQRVKVQDDLNKYAKLFPMLNIGIRIGL
jgi:hypothetical protein